jgi:outer membrane lipoprotein carrier protein
VAVAVLGLAAWAGGGEAPPGDAAAVHELVARIASRQREVQRLSARFVQERESALLLEPESSSGRFWYRAPDRVRWEYDSPRRMVVLFDGRTLSTYLPGDRTLERVRVPSRQRKYLEFLVGTRPLDELLGQFRIAVRDPGGSAPFELRLEPVSRMVARHVDEIALTVDRELLLPVRVEYREADGDVTRYRFSHIRIDPEFDDGLFELRVFPGTTVRSLSRTGAAGG